MVNEPVNQPPRPSLASSSCGEGAVIRAESASLVAAIRERTPARLLLERRGGSYRTRDQVVLREDHAAAVDAVWKPFDPETDWNPDFRRRWTFLETTSAAETREVYIRRPDLGRSLAAAAAARVAAECRPGADLQIVVGDGLSAAAVAVQVPLLLPLLAAEAGARGWSLGRPILVRHCRVGILNHLGAILSPRVAVLLLGERPGLRCVESLSAYMAFRPAPHHTDAHRNLVSNIHAAGTPPDQAADRIMRLVEAIIRQGTSGPIVKEEMHRVGSAGSMPLGIATDGSMKRRR